MLTSSDPEPPCPRSHPKEIITKSVQKFKYKEGCLKSRSILVGENEENLKAQ